MALELGIGGGCAAVLGGAVCGIGGGDVDAATGDVLRREDEDERKRGVWEGESLGDWLRAAARMQLRQIISVVFMGCKCCGERLQIEHKCLVGDGLFFRRIRESGNQDAFPPPWPGQSQDTLILPRQASGII